MGLFSGSKKAEKRRETLDISASQLMIILKKAVLLAIEDIEARSFTFGPEIMFEYGDEIHFMGVKYDKKRARKEKRILYCEELMSVYLDKQDYLTPEELFEKADIQGIKLNQITSGIIVAPEYRELL